MRVPIQAIPNRVFPSLKIFISYAHGHGGAMAGALKKSFERQNCEVFVAHDDIVPGSSWQDEIEAALQEAEIVLPLLTSGFRQSLWTDQEVGMAVAASKFIVPLRVDIIPYGFIARLQALRHDPKESYRTARRVIELAAGQGPLREKAMNSLAASFRQAGSFDSANELAAVLEKLGSVTVAQAEDILLGGAFNGQVFHGTTAAPFVQRVFDRYKDNISSTLIRAYQNTRRWIESEARQGIPPGKYEELMGAAIERGARDGALLQALEEIEKTYEPEDKSVR